jgi:pilus assembly protein Flp/PilA
MEASMDLSILKTWLLAWFNVESERGASMVEYGLLLALIAAVAIVAVRAFGEGVSGQFSGISSNVDAV